MSMVVSASAVTVPHEQAHDVEFTGGEAHAADGAERVSGEVEAGVPVAENVHLRALAPEQGVNAGLGVFRAVFAVRHDLNLKTAQLQERSQPLGQQRLVLDYKYFH